VPPHRKSSWFLKGGGDVDFVVSDLDPDRFTVRQADAR
jgi:hypothetical protein